MGVPVPGEGLFQRTNIMSCHLFASHNEMKSHLAFLHFISSFSWRFVCFFCFSVWNLFTNHLWGVPCFGKGFLNGLYLYAETWSKTGVSNSPWWSWTLLLSGSWDISLQFWYFACYYWHILKVCESLEMFYTLIPFFFFLFLCKFFLFAYIETEMHA